METHDKKAIRIIRVQARYDNVLLEIELQTPGVYKLYYSDDNDSASNGQVIINKKSLKGLRAFLQEINIV
jgi:hypothetical protein